MRANRANGRLSGLLRVSSAAWLVAASVVAGAATPCLAQEAASAPATQPTSAEAWPVSGIKIEYEIPHQKQKPVWWVESTSVTLSQEGDTWSAPKAGFPKRTMSIREIGSEGVMKLQPSAVQEISNAIAKSFAGAGVVAVYVHVHPDDMTEDGEDLRPAGQSELRLQVLQGTIREVRTVAQGERIDPTESLNHSKHEVIRERSPLQGATVDSEGKPVARTGDPLDREELEGYAAQLSRHPGRRVDVAVSAADAPGEVTLDYLVSEVRPWYLWAQVSNTGTENTSEWRERFGVAHTQLTGNDDILSAEYQTSSFDSSSQGFSLAYDTPLISPKLRSRTSFSWSEFTASDLGQFLSEFEGEQYGASQEFALNVGQWKDTFLDVYAGMAWENIMGNADPTSAEVEGRADFWEPFVGMRVERNRETHTWFADLKYMYGETSDSPEDVQRLGRLPAETDFNLLRLTAVHSFFIEPLLYGKKFEEGKGTLANELALSFQGQYSFDGIPIAQQQQTVGGLYTVRGYEESLVAADDAAVFTAEYRLHLPRAMGVEATPGKLFGQDFRWVPDRRLGRPDWDLIFRSFFDAGFTRTNDTKDQDQLYGAGVGLELQIRQNFSLRLDWGFALKDVMDDAGQVEVSSGDNRLHVLCSFMY